MELVKGNEIMYSSYGSPYHGAQLSVVWSACLHALCWLLIDAWPYESS
jgi:hypothetical protein